LHLTDCNEFRKERLNSTRISMFIHPHSHCGYHTKYRTHTSHKGAHKRITSCIQFPFRALNVLSVLFHVYVGSIFLRDIFGKEQLSSEIYHDVTRISDVTLIGLCDVFSPASAIVTLPTKLNEPRRSGNSCHCYLTNTIGSCKKERRKEREF
jgi:hypothetical protein